MSDRDDLQMQRLREETRELDERSLQLLILRRFDDVVADSDKRMAASDRRFAKHDLALFGNEDLKVAGVVEETQTNTIFRQEAQIGLKLVRWLLIPTTTAAFVALAWDIWSKILVGS